MKVRTMSGAVVKKDDLVCPECREGHPERLSCIHTFEPRQRTSTIPNTRGAVPGIIPVPGLDPAYNAGDGSHFFGPGEGGNIADYEDLVDA